MGWHFNGKAIKTCFLERSKVNEERKNLMGIMTGVINLRQKLKEKTSI